MSVMFFPCANGIFKDKIAAELLKCFIPWASLAFFFVKWAFLQLWLLSPVCTNTPGCRGDGSKELEGLKASHEAAAPLCIIGTLQQCMLGESARISKWPFGTAFPSNSCDFHSPLWSSEEELPCLGLCLPKGAGVKVHRVPKAHRATVGNLEVILFAIAKQGQRHVMWKKRKDASAAVSQTARQLSHIN